MGIWRALKRISGRIIKGMVRGVFKVLSEQRFASEFKGVFRVRVSKRSLE